MPLVLQIGGVQIEPVTPRLLRVRPETDEPSVLAAIRRAEGNLDGTRRFFWVDAFKLRQLEAELQASSLRLVISAVWRRRLVAYPIPEHS